MTHVGIPPACRFTRRVAVLVAGITMAAVLATACNAGSPQGEFAENQALLASCNSTTPPASWVGIDATGSSASKAITSERMAAVESVARHTAVCGGHLRVVAFTASSAATSVLFDGSLVQHGATDNAKLRRVPQAVTSVMEKVRSGYGPAAGGLSQDASDVIGQLRLGAEWATQLGDVYQLHLVVLTDGFQTVGVNLAARVYDAHELRSMAEQVAVPKLAGASVTIAGLGRIAKGAPSSEMVEGLVIYYTRICELSKATTCVAVTDYTVAGKR